MLSLSKHWLDQYAIDNIYQFYQKSPLVNNLLFDRIQFIDIYFNDVEILFNKNVANYVKLIVAAEHGLLNIVKYLVSFRINHKHTNLALEMAVEKGHLNIVKYLVEPRINGVNSSSRTEGANIHADDDLPLLLATVYDHTDIVEYIQSLP